ncbi:hypothetical protein [Aquabacterium sp.]|uniref:hypothetical protein n=1 Tax=Aquabacterium sp. TaxID=1872578 RepID=UPI0035B4AA32
MGSLLSGFLTHQLRLRTALRGMQSPSPRSIAEHEDLAGLTVADAFGETTRVELIKPRRGRPYIYLILLTQASELLPAPPAAVDSKSLHAAMYTHSIYMKWRRHCEQR